MTATSCLGVFYYFDISKSLTFVNITIVREGNNLGIRFFVFPQNKPSIF